MRALTYSESRDLLEGWGGRADANSELSIEAPGRHLAQCPSNPSLGMIQRVVEASQPWTRCLLLITQTGVWPSSENEHLFYRLRASYGEDRLIEEAPGHLFLKHEAADLASFLQLGVLNGWDMFVFPWEDYCRIFHSHDEFFQFSFTSIEARNEFAGRL